MMILLIIRKSLFLVSSLFIFSLTFAQNEESVTITTYYPSPYGVYHELRVDQMAVGSAYSNPSTYPLSDGSLIVAGTIQATGFNMAAGAGAGKILTCRPYRKCFLANSGRMRRWCSVRAD